MWGVRPGASTLGITGDFTARRDKISLLFVENQEDSIGFYRLPSVAGGVAHMG